jgi:hypothetical protein
VDGGTLENYGYITGDGTVDATNSATISDRYEIDHWRGGSYAAAAAQASVYPMNEMSCNGIQTTINISDSSSFKGLVRVYAGSLYSQTRFELIGPNTKSSNALIRLSGGGTAQKTYSERDSRTTLTLNGGATFSSGSLELPTLGISISSSSCVFPLDGDIGLVLESGTYTVSEDYKMLPGSTVDVMDQANVEVASGKLLSVYSSFTDSYGSNKYPAGRAAAQLILHGGATLTVNGTIGGQVVAASDATTDKPAKVVLADGATLSATTTEVTTIESATLSSSVTNSQTITNALALYTADGAVSDVTPEAGATYYASDTKWATNPADLVETPEMTYLDGDLNKDGTVNIKDLNMLLDNYNKSGSDLDGDINNDGTVNIKDLNLLLDNYNKSAS